MKSFSDREELQMTDLDNSRVLKVCIPEQKKKLQAGFKIGNGMFKRNLK